MVEFFNTYGQKLITAIFVHLAYVLVSVTIGFIIALILGIALSRKPKYAKVVLPILSIFQTIPGIVFIGVLFIYLGMNPITVIVALSTYAVFPILKNIYTGITEVPEQYINVAKGCGMSKFQILYKVELPIALPSIIAGLRMAVIYIMSWAVLSSMIGQGGLGDFVYIGVSSNDPTLIIAGAIPASLMAILLSRLIEYVKLKIVPRGLQEVTDK